MSVVRRTSKEKKKHKKPRKRNTGRCQRILWRKEKRRRRWEESKFIEINGKKILKPKWRD